MRVGDVNLKLTADIADIQAGMSSAGGSVVGFSTRTGAAAAAVQQHADRMSAALAGTRERVDGLSAGMGAAAVQVQAHAAQIGAAVQQVARQNQISAGQTAMAWRMLPMQLQDLGVSIASGMSPLMAMVQQGPQITGAFGGVRATISAMSAAISPMAVGLGGAAAAFAAVGVAAYGGSQELSALDNVLLNTGSRIGMTAGQLNTMAQRLDGMGGVTQGSAVQALTVLAGTAGVTSEGIERITAAALRLESAGGPAVAETAKRFSELGQAPLAAALKLHEQTGFLTEAVYRQVKALEDQGRVTEAARVAQDAYASVIEGRIPAMTANLGSMERAWLGIKGAAAEAWDAMKGVGRAETTEDRLIAAQKRLEELRARAAKGGGMYGAQLTMTPDGLRNVDAVLKQQEAEVQRLQAAKAFDDALAKQQQRSAQATKDLAAWDQQGVQYLTNQAKMAQEVARAREAGAAAGRSQAEIDARVAAIQAKYADKTPKSNVEPFVAQRDAAKEWASAIERLQGIQADAEGQATGYGKAQQAVMEAFRSPAFLAAPASWKAVFVATAEAAIAAEQQASAQKRATEVAREANKAHADLIAGLARSAQGALDQADKLQVEEQAAAMAAQRNVSLALAIEQVSIARLREKQAEMMGNEDAVLAIQREIDARSRLMDLIRRKDGRAADDKGKDESTRRLDAYLNKDVGTDLSAGFDKASQSLGQFVQQFMRLNDEQSAYLQAQRDAGTNTDKLAAVEARHAQAQISGYAAMAGAAKGMFAQNSAGYRAMAAAEKALRVAQLAGAIGTAAKQIGLIGAVTTAAVDGDATMALSDTTRAGVEQSNSFLTAAAKGAEAVVNAIRSMPFPANLAAGAATAAAIASLGVAITGGGGSVGSANAGNTGTGTVLGDKDARSESVGNSIDRLTEVDTLTMRYSAQMLASVRNIESGIGGMVTYMVQTGAISTDLAKGLNYSGSGALAALGEGVADVLTLGLVPAVGEAVARVVGGRSRVQQQGITFGAQSLGSVLSSGSLEGEAFVNYRARKNYVDDWDDYRKTAELDAQVEQRLARAFAAINGTMLSASEALGLNATEVQDALNAYVVRIGDVDLKGLSADAQIERLTAVLSAESDRIVQQVLAGQMGVINAYAQADEGYLETVVRMATGSEEAGLALRRLGVQMVSLADVANQQADDVGAELVRSSLVAAETVREITGYTSRWIGRRAIITETVSGIGEIISTLDGSAEEIASAYTALTDVRESLQLLGVSGAAVTRDLVSGAGGIDALTDGLAAFESAFTTSQAQASAATARLRTDIERLGLAMPNSAQGFADLVRGIDTSSAAGKELLGAVLQLSGQAADVWGSLSDIADERSGLEEQLLQLQGDTAALRALELNGLDASNRALQQRIWALRDEQERLNALANAGKGISSLIEELRGGTSSSTSLVQLRAAYDSQLQAAQGGDISASESIAGTARTLIDAIKASASDPLQLALETARIASQLQALPAIAALQQQASEQASAAISAAATSSQAAADAAAAASSGATSTTSTAQASTATELQALRSAVADLTAEVQRLRSGQESGLASIAASTGRAARLLDDLTDDGQSLNVRLTS